MVDARLVIDGEVDAPLRLSFADLAAIDAEFQIVDVGTLDPKRSGDAVRLEGLLQRSGVRPDAAWLTLHASRDDFHASIPLTAIRARAIVIYRLQGEPLPVAAGGPFRFFVPDFAACHSAEVDECANVKFVDRIELSAVRGFDNRPHDADEHAELHHKESTGGA
ncbi:MAG: molybdopterin-dependent oxidoreductase [Planctomycetia bacterium]|nr:molybdopterin-dependent oxidoreductase [Planctomycetia bacterium]